MPILEHCSTIKYPLTGGKQNFLLVTDIQWCYNENPKELGGLPLKHRSMSVRNVSKAETQILSLVLSCWAKDHTLLDCKFQ